MTLLKRLKWFLSGFLILGAVAPVFPEDMQLLYSYQYRPSFYESRAINGSTTPALKTDGFIDDDKNDRVSVSVFQKLDGSTVKVQIPDSTYGLMGVREGQQYNPTKEEAVSLIQKITPKASAAITYDTSATGEANASSVTYSITPTANANTAIVINAVGHYSGATSDPSSVTYNGNAATKYCSQLNTTWGSDTPQSLWGYYIGTPDGSAHNVVVDFSTGINLRTESGAMTVYGTHTAPFTGGGSASNEGNSSSQSVTLTTTYDNSWVVDGYNYNGTIALRNPDASSPTVRRYRADSGEGSSFAGGTTPTTAAGSYSSTWTTSLGLFWTGCAIEVRAGASVAGTDSIEGTDIITWID